MHYLAVCAIFRDEAPYLAEWICFHRLVGVEHFYLYDNGSNDRPHRVLRPLIERGLVTLEHWPIPFHEKAQKPAYQHCLERARSGKLARWIAFIDLDEFLFSPARGKLPDELRPYEDHPGVVVNWQCYGSSGHRKTDEAPVIARFTRRARRNWVRNRKVKSIIDPARTLRAEGVHYFAHDDGEPSVDEARKLVMIGKTQPLRRRLRRWYRLLGPLLRFADPYSNRDVGGRQVRVERLRINHYPVKSYEEFLKKARLKKEKRRYEDLDYFAYHDRNEILDTVLLRFVPALETELKVIGIEPHPALSARPDTSPKSVSQIP